VRATRDSRAPDSAFARCGRAISRVSNCVRALRPQLLPPRLDRSTLTKPKYFHAPAVRAIPGRYGRRVFAKCGRRAARRSPDCAAVRDLHRVPLTPATEQHRHRPQAYSKLCWSFRRRTHPNGRTPAPASPPRREVSNLEGNSYVSSDSPQMLRQSAAVPQYFPESGTAPHPASPALPAESKTSARSRIGPTSRRAPRSP
jgi:hypothetical protein